MYSVVVSANPQVIPPKFQPENQTAQLYPKLPNFQLFLPINLDAAGEQNHPTQDDDDHDDKRPCKVFSYDVHTQLLKEHRDVDGGVVRRHAHHLDGKGAAGGK